MTGPSTRTTLDRLLATLRAHRPADARESRSLVRTRALFDWLPAPLDEHADPTHVTAAAIVLDQRGRVVLHRHKRLGIWVQPGGHLDVGETPAQAAVRETAEETGLAAVDPPIGPLLVHVDVHEGPRGHVHLDLRYLLSADGDAPLAPGPGESPRVAWFAPDEAAGRVDAGLVTAITTARGVTAGSASSAGAHR